MPTKPNLKIQSPDISQKVMSQINSGKIKMKPRLYFLAGSIIGFLSLISLAIASIFLLNLTLFLIRKQGPGYHRLQVMLSSFPWWIPILGLIFLIAAILLLKKYDFSYRRNFALIIFSFILAIIISVWVIDYLGISQIWSKRSLRRFYQPLKSNHHQMFNQFKSRQFKPLK